MEMFIDTDVMDGNSELIIYALVVAAVTALFIYLILKRAKLIKMPKIKHTQKKRHK